MDQNLFSKSNLLEKIQDLYHNCRVKGKNPEAILLGSETYLEFVDQIRMAYPPMSRPQFEDVIKIYMGMTIYVVRYDPYLVKVI